MAETKLKPCPFCGSDKGPEEDEPVLGKCYLVFCRDCGASGGIRDSREKAAENWNRRAGDE